MQVYDLRDPELARQYLLQGLLLSRAAQINEKTVAQTLRWAMEVVSEGAPLPCVGFVGDVGQIACGILRTEESDLLKIEGLDRTLTRQYEDYVLGKIYSDWSFERASDALKLDLYRGRDHERGVAYIVNQICKRSVNHGAMLSLAVIKTLLDQSSTEILEAALQSVSEDGWSEQLMYEFRELIVSVRNTGDLLGSEDVFELEQGTALAEFGQRVALRQVLKAAAELEFGLPHQKPRTPARKYSVATNIMEEDYYPIGGFTSISNRGTMESLLRSELAYLEDEGDRPDLFDIKYVRDELLYYSRDENQFLRRRLAFLFVLKLDLRAARFKDAELPLQRIILMLALLVVAIRKLVEWLSDDAIVFEFLFVESKGKKKLADEKTLVETIFREEIKNGVVCVRSTHSQELPAYCDEIARKSLCHATVFTTNKQENSQSITGDFAIRSEVKLHSALPVLFLEDRPPWQSDEEGISGWEETLDTLLRFWL